MERGLALLAGIEPASACVPFSRSCRLSYSSVSPCAPMPITRRAVKGGVSAFTEIVPPEGLEPSALLMR